MGKKSVQNTWLDSVNHWTCPSAYRADDRR